MAGDARDAPQEAPVISGTRVSVVIPCYRVARELPGVLRLMPASVDQIIVVDDASPDDLRDVLAAIDEPRLTVLHHAENRGVGAATATGMRRALADGADVIVKCDGDGQMDPGAIPSLVRPLATGSADHAKGSRYHHPRALNDMPRARLLGNVGLTFMTKLCSGYWNVLDPVNGFFATRADVLARLPLDQLSPRYFFESDLLIRLNVLEARVADIPLPARYGDEVSSLSPARALLDFPPRLLAGLARRVYLRYLVRDVSPVAVFAIVGALLAAAGLVFGLWHWWVNASAGVPTPLGTIMLALVPQALGVQLILQAIVLDIANTPRPAERTSALVYRFDAHEAALEGGELADDGSRDSDAPGQRPMVSDASLGRVELH